MSGKVKISLEQKELSDYVKGVHLSLRRKARQHGAEKAWEEHLGNDKVLRKYAICLKELSENYWSVNNGSDDDKIECRIKWIANRIIDYFQNGLLKKEVEKEMRKMQSFFNKNLLGDEEFESCYGSNSESVRKPPYKTLDVGSCYNPFGKFEFLTVFPIDLCPAVSGVKKCDFTDVEIKMAENWFDSVDSREIPSDFFDVVVFSLFLEYLPSPKQRYQSCVNAYKCLKGNGLLLIATPDSKHPTANASIMKKWKIAAACIGFNRICLEKLKYLHCMAFRKSISSKYPAVLERLKVDDWNPEELFVIPQDSTEYENEKSVGDAAEKNEPERKLMFCELPFP